MDNFKAIVADLAMPRDYDLYSDIPNVPRHRLLAQFLRLEKRVSYTVLFSDCAFTVSFDYSNDLGRCIRGTKPLDAASSQVIAGHLLVIADVDAAIDKCGIVPCAAFHNRLPVSTSRQTRMPKSRPKTLCPRTIGLANLLRIVD